VTNSLGLLLDFFSEIAQLDSNPLYRHAQYDADRNGLRLVDRVRSDVYDQQETCHQQNYNRETSKRIDLNHMKKLIWRITSNVNELSRG